MLAGFGKSMEVSAGTINNFGNSLSNSAVTGGIKNSSSGPAAPLLAEVTSRQPGLRLQTATAASDTAAAQPQQTTEQNSESVRVSSSIGRAASAGQLTREQALEIYRNIARFL